MRVGYHYPKAVSVCSRCEAVFGGHISWMHGESKGAIHEAILDSHGSACRLPSRGARPACSCCRALCLLDGVLSGSMPVVGPERR